MSPDDERAGCCCFSMMLQPQATPPKKQRKTRAVWLGRILFISVLSLVAAGLAFAAFHVLTSQEQRLAQEQYESFTDRGLKEALTVASQRRWSVAAMAEMVGELHPDAETWPFVSVTGFERIAESLLNASSGFDIGLAPIVQPSQQSKFEDHAYDYYYNRRNPPMPPGTAESSFGKGIWAMDRSLNNTDKRYHDIGGSGARTWKSPNQILAPLFQSAHGTDSSLMLNAHFEPTPGRAIDAMLDCSQKRALNGSMTEHGYVVYDEATKCGVSTSLFNVISYDFKPGAGLFQPVYPANDRSKMVGVVGSILLFEEVLLGIFSSEVSGIDCVIATEAEAITYTIEHGIPRLVGEGDLHDPRYDKFQKGCDLTRPELYMEGSPYFTIDLYPNDDLYQVYKTTNPIVAAVGALCIIIFTTAAFFLYDFFVRREFSAKKELLQAKRQFMRFVSHEVRTPLNSVCMGLTILQSEIAAALGYDSAKSLQQQLGEQPAPAKKMLPPDKAREWFALARDIESNTQDAVGVLTDLLNYDKIEQGTLSLEKKVVNIWRLVEETVEEFKLPAAEKDLDLRLNFDTSDEGAHSTSSTANEIPTTIRSLRLIGDDIRVTQVLRNLISNAVKFTPQRGKLEVCVTLVDDSAGERDSAEIAFVDIDGKPGHSAYRRGMVRISVIDSGVGMTAAQVESVFKDGTQFNVGELQAGKGSGLGLYIASGIVVQHGGSLTAMSDGLGKGATFTMTLPLWSIADMADWTESSSATAPATPERLPLPQEPLSLKVLVVDDIRTNRRLLSRLLSNRGHACDEAENGAIALDLFRQAFKIGAPYDSVVMDYEMPVMNGPDATKEIRRLGCADVSVIGITGNVLPDDVAYFIACGADAVLPKPLKVADLESIWRSRAITESCTTFSQQSRDHQARACFDMVVEV